ncbi:MAG: peptidoglycan-binding protein [Cyanobacteria bacterium]|nr:peptidoglycan-binding protein [Cyanobacteriota bacterium]
MRRCPHRFGARGQWWQPLASGAIALPLVMMTGLDPAIAAPGAAAAPLALAQTTASRPILRLGSEGPAVKELQGMLTLLGYYTEAVNGEFSTATATAVQAFQVAAGLTPDGIVGPATWARLLPTPSTEFTPPPATGGDTADETPPAADETAADNGAIATPTTAVTSPVDLPTLRVGMYGPAVTRVQERLQRLDFYAGALDGVFGPQTEAAVKAFQRSRQLSADGIIGPATWQALFR